LTLIGAALLTCGAALAQEAEAQAREPVACASCHDEAFQVKDLWRTGMDETEPTGCQHHDEIVRLRRSLNTVDDGVMRLSAILANMEGEGIEVGAMRETWDQASARFGLLTESEVATDLDTFAENGKISLALQKLYGATGKARQEMKGRLVFAVIFLTTLLVFLAILTGLKMYLPEPVGPPLEEEANAEKRELAETAMHGAG